MYATNSGKVDYYYHKCLRLLGLTLTLIACTIENIVEEHKSVMHNKFEPVWSVVISSVHLRFSK